MGKMNVKHKMNLEKKKKEEYNIEEQPQRRDRKEITKGRPLLRHSTDLN